MDFCGSSVKYSFIISRPGSPGPAGVMWRRLFFLFFFLNHTWLQAFYQNHSTKTLFISFLKCPIDERHRSYNHTRFPVCSWFPGCAAQYPAALISDAHNESRRTVSLPGGHRLFCLLLCGRLSGHLSWEMLLRWSRGQEKARKALHGDKQGGLNECWLKSRCSLHSHTKEIMTFREHCVRVDMCVVCAFVHVCMQTASFRASVECRYCRFRSEKRRCHESI